MKNIKKLFSSLSSCYVSRQAITVLLAGLAVVLIQLGYIAFDVLWGTHENALYIVALYQKCLEYIMLEFVILIAGAFLFDLAVREGAKF